MQLMKFNRNKPLLEWLNSFLLQGSHLKFLVFKLYLIGDKKKHFLIEPTPANVTL